MFFYVFRLRPPHDPSSPGPGGPSDPGLSFVEARSHFGAWCIVSSPLVLSHDTTNDTVSDAIWPIIANREAIAINQAWAGESGTLYATFPAQADVLQCLHATQPCYQLWSKKVDAATGATAVMVMNHAQAASGALSVAFAQVPSLAHLPAATKYRVRDVWAHRDLGVFADSVTVDSLAAHDSALLVVTPM